MSFITSLFKKSGTNITPAAGVNIQVSVYGKPIPLIYGMTKVPGILIIYGNFIATAVSTPTASGGGGGKGSLFSSSGNSGTSYVYNVTVAFAFCEGPISGANRVWKGTAISSVPGWGFGFFFGTYPQAVWSYAITWEVTDENEIVQSGSVTPLGYNGIAYANGPNISLGSDTSLPNYQWEVEGVYWNTVGDASATPYDALPSLVLTDFLTNSHYGLGFPSSLLGSFTQWDNYCKAYQFGISPAYTTQRTASDMIDEIMTATNSACFWSSGKFNVTPYGDQVGTANGATFTPNLTPIYALGDDDFIREPQNNIGASASAGSAGPVLLTRKRKSDTINSIKIEYLDRNNNYNPSVAYANNQSEIDSYGLRTNGSKQLHLFASATAANLSAALQLRRELVTNQYRFDLDQRYILLDPMDIISITDSNLGVSGLLVRIIEIDENDDGTLSFVCEEVAQGTGSAPKYTFAQGSGQPLVNTNGAPGSINAPIFFEPPFALNGALEVYCALSGAATWGGAEVWVSTDGLNYTLVDIVKGSCRMGNLTGTLPSVTEAVTGETIDQSNTLSIDLTESAGTLTSASVGEAQKLTTLCYVDGELIAYANATLTATNKYNLTYLVRGAYGSTISTHATNTAFARLDIGIAKISFTQDRVGQTISVKFLSFNQYGGGKLSLAQVSPVTYTIQGRALAVPPADVSNLAAVFVGNLAEIGWSEVSDFRSILYEIREGSSWDGGQFRSRQAHPPFRVQGDGTYWIAVYTQPSPGLVVYSANPQSIGIVGSNIVANIVASHQEDPSWPGSLSGSVAKVGATIQTTGVGGGTYTIPAGDRIIITFPFACAVIMKWTSSASPLNNSLFDYSGVATLVSGSTVIRNLVNFTGTGRLYGNTLIDNLATTKNMGAGQPITGIGISSGTVILAVLSTSSIAITVPASTGSTSAASTQSLTVYPFLSPGLYVEATSTTIIPSGMKIASTSSTDYSVCYVSSTPLVSSTVDKINITIDFLNTADLFGAAAAANATVFPQLRLSQDKGVTWGAWQNWQAGYYVGSAFDAQMLVETDDINSIGILETFTFSVDVPNRIDHFVGISVSSLGSTIVFRPDGQTTAAFNGGNGGSTQPTVLSIITSGNPSRTVVASNITLAQCLLTCYSSTGGPVADSVNAVAEGF